MIYRTLLVPLTQPGRPIVPDWIGDVPTLAQRTRAWFLLESYGKVVMDFTTSPTFVAAFYLQAYAPLIAAGFDPAQYDRIIYLQDNVATTGYKGLNWGKESSVQCMGVDYAFFAAIHELGHSFGLPHPIMINYLGAWAGNVYTLPPLSVKTGGQITGTYDPSTSMGYQATWASFNGPEIAQLGWTVPLVYAGGDKTVTLTALGVPGSDLLRVVKIPCTAWSASSARTYWLEYRIDALDQNGVQLHVSGDFDCYMPAHVGGMFGVGQTIADGTTTIDVLSMTATTATLRLRDTPVILPPQQTGNTQMLIDTIKADAAALVLGQITQAQIDKLKADTAQLVPDATTAPPPTGSAWAVPPAASGTDAQGHVWSLGAASQYGKLVLRDGQQFASGQATLIDYRNGVVKVQNNAGQWWTPSGNGWVATGAP